MFVANSLLGDLIAVFITVGVLITLYFKWTYQYWARRNVPQLEPRIPFGNITESMRGREFVGVTFKKIYQKMKSQKYRHGGIYIFTQPSYFPIDLDYIRNILTKDFQYFVDRPFYVNEKDPLQAHLLNLSGTRWRNMRSKLTPTFTSGKMKMMFQIMAESQSDLFRRTDKEVKSLEPINIKEILACFTTNIIGSCAFGLDCKALEDENSPFREFGKRIFKTTVFQRFKRTFAATFPDFARFLRLSSGRKENAKFIMDMVESTIDYREKNNYSRNDFMQLMIDLKNNKPKGDHDGKPLTLDEVASQAIVFFAAGFETSSTLMTFAFYELAKNPDIQTKLREEINSVLAKYNNEISYDAIQDMKYLNQVVDETLRLHPPAAQTSRRCIKDYKIPDQDVVIKKGTSVTISILGIHHDPEYYPDPEKFDPERFTEENKSLRHNYAFLPFGEGPRNCIGMRFGLLQSKMGLVALIKNYKFTVNKKTKEPITYQPAHVVLAAQGEIWLNAQKI
ncbi:probable cytochrome P450 6a13 [Tribolium madens]|uniref:probable cytochrome P450 6a13 n=1 Tax=Tribolium madens TaxID=41895 RepID=UPI001CF72303|nr:probable cytochrome P450 6a13 [Tribolium madens]